MRLFCFFMATFPLSVAAQDYAQITADVVRQHILPGFHVLAERADRLHDAALADCSANDPVLRESYGAAFDAWIAVSHLRFGPTEVEDRAYALAFWPDSRGATPRVLAALIKDEDSVAKDPDAYSEVSIAARGFYALEFLLYDEALTVAGDDAYRCRLLQTITADIANMIDAIARDWESGYATQMTMPSPGSTYRNQEETMQVLFKSLSTGLQITSDIRIGRPLGTIDHPRPKRAEAWRSGRSLHHIEISLDALRAIALLLAETDPMVMTRLEIAFDRAHALIVDLDDPTFANVADPQGRFRVEALKNAIDNILAIVRDELGPTLGVTAGFNALDGD